MYTYIYNMYRNIMWEIIWCTNFISIRILVERNVHNGKNCLEFLDSPLLLRFEPKPSLFGFESVWV